MLAPGTQSARRPRTHPARQHRRPDRAWAGTRRGGVDLHRRASRSTSSSRPPGCGSCAKMDGAVVLSSDLSADPARSHAPDARLGRSPPRSRAHGTARLSGSRSRPASPSSRSPSRCGSSGCTSTATGIVLEGSSDALLSRANQAIQTRWSGTRHAARRSVRPRSRPSRSRTWSRCGTRPACLATAGDGVAHRGRAGALRGRAWASTAGCSASSWKN